MSTTGNTVTASVAGAAGRYATALFELAQEENLLDDIARDLDDLNNLLAESADLTALVSNPIFSREEKGNAMAAILDKAGAHPITKNFVGLVASKRRLYLLSDVIGAYKLLLSKHRGEISAEVISAVALSDGQVAALKDAMKQSVGKDVQLNTTVDPSILGGLVVKLGSRQVDSSLRTKLNNLKIAMKEVG